MHVHTENTGMILKMSSAVKLSVTNVTRAVCEITACQRTFSGQNAVCQGILIFAWTKCLDKVLAN